MRIVGGKTSTDNPEARHQVYDDDTLALVGALGLSLPPLCSIVRIMGTSLPDFIAKWLDSGAAERANKDAFLIELCDVLDVPRPTPTTGDAERDSYVFEKDAILPHEGGKTTIGKIDLYKAGAFILEAKQGSDPTSKKLGTAKRGTPGWALAMNGAYGQAIGYAKTFDKAVPFLIGCDIGHCFDLYASFDGSWNYRPFPDATRSRIFLKDLTLPQHRETLRRVFTDPLGLDPSRASAKVTREVAVHLAELAKALEAAKHDPEEVATFLMRCLFTMFAEDVGLLPERIFTDAIEQHWIENPKSFPVGIETLWRAMNDGGSFGFVGKLLRFNGGLFRAPKALPLTKGDLGLLLEAAKCNWADVEPAIFGTLLERALDPKERHALGAHYTPRAYVERLVRPTIEEPLRADWDVVQAEVRQLVAGNKLTAAKKAVRAFHQKLCATRVLDPACGSGNFLYVTLDLFKRLEGEVLEMSAALGDTQTLLEADTLRVTPAQFLGIEVKRWAKEIAELVLWIGYLQHHYRGHGKVRPPPEPVLQDYQNIECRDAVLAWDSIELVRDANGKPVTRWDGESYKKSAVTGEDVPDETKTVAVERYVNPRKAVWPKADFIVGNPPFLGASVMREGLGDGYVDAIRSAYSSVPQSADFVMYWWTSGATAVLSSNVRRCGFITTKAISQTFNSRVLEPFLGGTPPLSIVYAVPNHPWIDSDDGAQVRIAMTSVAMGSSVGRLAIVAKETWADGIPEVRLSHSDGRIQADLRIGANVRGVTSLRSNASLAAEGVKPHGMGFVLEAAAAAILSHQATPGLVRPYMNGRDLTHTPRGLSIIDLHGLTIADVQHKAPTIYQHVLTHVKPERDQNREPSRRANWWLFGRKNTEMRAALADLERYIATVKTSKHRVFVFLPRETVPDSKLIVVASDDSAIMGILQGRVHLVWALSTGARLGVGDDPTYVKSKCFDTFPFPPLADAGLSRVRALAESLDGHRKRQQALYPGLTITGMYNVLEKLRAGEALTAKDDVIHEHGLVSVLKQLHDDLDTAVLDAYGWPHDLTDEQILERVVALNAERGAEERNGLVRWLRPEFQNPGGTKAATQTEMVGATEQADDEDDGAPVAAPAWPKKMAEQVTVVRDLVAKSPGEWTAAQGARAFKGSKAGEVGDVMDALAAVGLLAGYGEGGERRWRAVG
jgi:hypothetical protein